MCGLVGAYGDITYQVKEVVGLLLQLDTIRGKDSTGVALIGKDRSISLVKEAVPGWVFADKKEGLYRNNIVNKHNLRGIIGHNRLATMGQINADNAHPFHHGNIVGAHNGTLTGRWGDKLDDWNKFDVDSECIFYNINKNSFVETYKRMHGAWALTWYNAEEDTFNIIRNEQRPLYVVWTEDLKILLWASEAWMLDVACDRFNLKIGKKKLLDPHIHYEFANPTVNFDGQVRYWDRKDKLKCFEPPVVQNYYGGDYWANGRRYNDYVMKKAPLFFVANSKDESYIYGDEVSPDRTKLGEVRIYYKNMVSTPVEHNMFKLLLNFNNTIFAAEDSFSTGGLKNGSYSMKGISLKNVSVAKKKLLNKLKRQANQNGTNGQTTQGGANNIIPFRPDLNLDTVYKPLGPNKSLIKKSDWDANNRRKYCCECCGEHPDFDDPGVEEQVVWHSKDVMTCSDKGCIDLVAPWFDKTSPIY